MKSLIVTLVILGALFLAYDGFLAPPSERMVFPRVPLTQAERERASRPAEAPVAETEPTSVSAPRSSTDGTPVAPATAGTSSAKPAATAPATPKHLPGEFQPPLFDPIEVLTGNWQKIPQSAFGRMVKLAKPVVLKMSFGESSVGAGQLVDALGMANGWVVVAPTADSPARGYVALDDTDLKAQLVEAYEAWKIERTAFLKRQFDKRRQMQGSVASEAPAGMSGPTTSPERSGDGTYPLLLAKMRSGDPIEITPQNITRWGGAEKVMIKGIPTWTIDVTYNAKTMFGIQSVETTAQVQNGRVVAWIYKGSGEPVP